VRRQEDDCRQVAERLGWSVACVYTDNGLSASQFATKPRNDYTRLLDDIKAHKLDAVVVWMEDRSHRQVIELAEFVKACRAAGVSRYASVGTEYDLSDPEQVTMLSSMARISESEVGRISIRVKRSSRNWLTPGSTTAARSPTDLRARSRMRMGLSPIRPASARPSSTKRQRLSVKRLGGS
jgi:site-specific DNA recombinase